MMGALNYTTWQPERPYYIKQESDMKETTKKESSSSAKILLRKAFWTSVAAVNVLIIADVLLNSGSVLINVLYELTGGYKG